MVYGVPNKDVLGKFQFASRYPPLKAGSRVRTGIGRKVGNPTKQGIQGKGAARPQGKQLQKGAEIDRRRQASVFPKTGKIEAIGANAERPTSRFAADVQEQVGEYITLRFPISS